MYGWVGCWNWELQRHYEERTDRWTHSKETKLNERRIDGGTVFLIYESFSKYVAVFVCVYGNEAVDCKSCMLSRSSEKLMCNRDVYSHINGISKYAKIASNDLFGGSLFCSSMRGYLCTMFQSWKINEHWDCWFLCLLTFWFLFFFSICTYRYEWK